MTALCGDVDAGGGRRSPHQLVVEVNVVVLAQRALARKPVPGAASGIAVAASAVQAHHRDQSMNGTQVNHILRISGVGT